MNQNKTIRGVILDTTISVNQIHEILVKYLAPYSDEEAWKLIEDALMVYKENLLKRLDLGNQAIKM